MDAHTHQTEPAPVVAAAQLILHALSEMSKHGNGFKEIRSESDKSRVRYNIDSKAGQLLIRAIAFLIADARQLVEPGEREAFVDGAIKDIIKTRSVQPHWHSLLIDEIAPRLQAAINDLLRDLIWVEAKG